MNSKIGKKGIVYIYFVIGFAVVIFTIIYMCIIFKLYFEKSVFQVKKDLFYIVQNSVSVSLDINKLEYGEYAIDNEKLKKCTEKLLYENYNDRVLLKMIEYNNKIAKIEVILKFNFWIFNDIDIVLKENVKVSLMGVN